MRGQDLGAGDTVSAHSWNAAAAGWHEEAVFERGTIKTANNGVHFLFIRGFDKSETFGFLGLRIANDLDGICHQIIRQSHALISSAVTQGGRLPRNTVELIYLGFSTQLGIRTRFVHEALLG